MKRPLKWIGISLGGLIALGLVAATAFALIGRSRINSRYVVTTTLAPDAMRAASLEVGERIVHTRGCQECHAQGLRGNVFLDIPPGFIVAPNLTKGKGGVGRRYKDLDDWHRAFAFGIRPDSTVLTPFMPYDFYHRLNDVDAASLAVYLANLPPIDNDVPQLKLRPLGYVIMGLPNMNPRAKIAELSKPRAVQTAGRTAEYGRYVASTTCVACHGEDLLGGSHANPEGAPGPELSHVGQWSVDDFITALRTGVAPGGRQIGTWMPWKEMGMLTDDELVAIHEYLKTLKSTGNRTSNGQ